MDRHTCDRHSQVWCLMASLTVPPVAPLEIGSGHPPISHTSRNSDYASRLESTSLIDIYFSSAVYGSALRLLHGLLILRLHFTTLQRVFSPSQHDQLPYALSCSLSSLSAYI